MHCCQQQGKYRLERLFCSTLNLFQNITPLSCSCIPVSSDIQATQCLAATNRLESQQADIIRSIEDHADRTRDHVAQQLRQAMETIGEVLEVTSEDI
jgi:hypothetical protein